MLLVLWPASGFVHSDAVSWLALACIG